MARFADPHLCPDCRGPIAAGATRCSRCGLPLRGEVARDLFRTLTQADALLATLRAAATMPGPAQVKAVAAEEKAAQAKPLLPPLDPRRGLGASSVPAILLALGAACLLVAALVFLAVTWSVLGVGGRTAVLIALTVVAAGTAVALFARRLRATADAVALVGYGLLGLDLVGARGAGWFGDLGGSTVLGVIGALLALAGAAGALSARGAGGRLVSGEAVVVVGLGLAGLALTTSGWSSPQVALLLVTLAAGAVAAAGRSLGLAVAATGAAAIAGLTWSALAVIALVQIFVAPELSWAWLWAGLRVWPLLAAAAVAAGVAGIRTLPHIARVAGASVATLLIGCAVTAPAVRLDPTPGLLVVSGVLLAVAATGLVLPRRWWAATAATLVVAGLVVVGAAAALVARVVARVVTVEPWSRSATDRFDPSDPAGAAGWLLPVLVGTTLAAALAADRALWARPSWRPPPTGATALAAAVVALTPALYGVQLWLPAVLLLAVTAGLAARWFRGDDAALAAAAGIGTAALAAAMPAQALTAAALTVLAALACLVAGHAGRPPRTGTAAAGATALALLLAAGVWTWSDLVGSRPGVSGLLALLALGALLLVGPRSAHRPPAPWLARPGAVRAGAQAGALAVAPVVGVLSADLADPAEQNVWVAVYLTVAGATVTVISLVQADRRWWGLVGGLLLAAASWVRLADVGVQVPEAFTLPSAVALVGAGLLHLRRDRTTSTLSALGPGLALALGPSLVLALGEPTGLRSGLLGAGCLAFVIGGAALRWSAPLLLGASSAALLVLRQAAPAVGDALPRWVLLGLAGALLLALGATWERRLQEVRRAVGYLQRLR